MGGLAFPSFIHYYWAANIQKRLLWLYGLQSVWCTLEAQAWCSSSLPALVLSSLSVKPSRYRSNPMVLSTLKMWIQFQNHYKFKAPSVLGPISNNHLFSPSALDFAFSKWKDVGLKCFKDVFHNNIFPCLDHLCQKYNLPCFNWLDFFKCVILCNFFFPHSLLSHHSLVWKIC